jgi:hypothetical protein
VTYFRIKENPAQPFGLPDRPNDRIYPVIRKLRHKPHKADFNLERSILIKLLLSPDQTIVNRIDGLETH